MNTNQPVPASLIEVFWIEKYLTFSQTADDQLVATDCLFLAEYALRGMAEDSKLFEAAVFRNGEMEPVQTYTGVDPLWRNDLWVNRKVRSFDSLAQLEAAYPATDSFHWEVRGTVAGSTPPIRIGGPNGKTDIPQPHAMRLFQNDVRISDYRAIDLKLPLVIEWDKFPRGSTGSVVDDLIFLFIDDCYGDIAFFGGLPVDPEYITYRSTSATIPPGTLRPGEPFTIFFSQCRVVDQEDTTGIMNLAINSFGVELDIHTAGEATSAERPQPRLRAPFMWLRKTSAGPGLETWPTIVDGRHCAPHVIHNVNRSR